MRKEFFITNGKDRITSNSRHWKYSAISSEKNVIRGGGITKIIHNIKKIEYNAYFYMRKEKYEDFKKRLGKNCKDCGSILCPNNQSGFCRSCSMKNVVSKNLGNKPELDENTLKKIEKIKKGYHKFEDIELIELWARGDSDGDIAKLMKVSTSVVTKRRYKLGLEANFRPFFGDNLNKEQMKERNEERLETLAELISRYEEDPNYYNKKRYKNHKKNYGRDFINEESKKSYNKRNNECNHKCKECNTKLALKNKTGLCISCSQKSFTDEEFYNLYRQGFGDYDIADILKVSPNSVWKRRNKFGLPNNNDLNLKIEVESGNVLQNMQITN